MKEIPSKLYHYCSIESFFHIINSKSIWLSNSRQMNDANENIWIQKYFEIIKDYFNDPKYQDLLDRAFDIYNWNSNPPYVFCLSGSKDLLSQWRAYSQDGQGVSIGFSTKFLNFKREIPAPNVYAHQTLGIAKVEYQTFTQKNKVLGLCRNIKEIFDAPEKEDEKIFLTLDLGLSLVNWALVFKNSSFKEESEWRIIHTPTNSYEETLENLSDLQFRLSNNKILTYFNYCFNKDFNSDLLSELVLGPKCKMSISEIKQFLKHNNLENTKVVQSKSTYR